MLLAFQMYLFLIQTELYNPNTIRASMGALFRLNIYEDKKDRIINFLKSNNFKILVVLLNPLRTLMK